MDRLCELLDYASVALKAVTETDTEAFRKIQHSCVPAAQKIRANIAEDGETFVEQLIRLKLLPSMSVTTLKMTRGFVEGVKQFAYTLEFAYEDLKTDQTLNIVATVSFCRDFLMRLMKSLKQKSHQKPSASCIHEIY